MNRFFRAPAPLAAALALSLVACGEDEGTPYTGGLPPLDDAAAYFGVTPCRCLEFVRDDGTFDVGLGIAVESVNDVYSVALEGGEYQYHVLRYRHGGQVKRTDFLRPTDPDLILAGVNYGDDDWDDLVRVDPGVPYLRYPLDQQPRPVTLDTFWQAAPGGSTVGEPTPLAYRADFTAATVIASLDGGPATELATIRALYDGLPWPEFTRHYVPEQGLVKLDLDLQDGEGRKTWVLKRVRQLGGGCPWDNAAALPGDQICGTNP